MKPSDEEEEISEMLQALRKLTDEVATLRKELRQRDSGQPTTAS